MTIQKLNKILNLKASLNWGLSNKLKKSFKYLNIIPVKRIYNNLSLINPYWISGFVSAHGSFTVRIINNRVLLKLRISQHIKDEKLKMKILDYFEVGNINYKKEHNSIYIEF